MAHSHLNSLKISILLIFIISCEKQIDKNNINEINALKEKLKSESFIIQDNFNFDNFESNFTGNFESNNSEFYAVKQFANKKIKLSKYKNCILQFEREFIFENYYYYEERLIENYDDIFNYHILSQFFKNFSIHMINSCDNTIQNGECRLEDLIIMQYDTIVRISNDIELSWQEPIEKRYKNTYEAKKFFYNYYELNKNRLTEIDTFTKSDREYKYIMGQILN